MLNRLPALYLSLGFTTLAFGQPQPPATPTGPTPLATPASSPESQQPAQPQPNEDVRVWPADADDWQHSIGVLPVK